jgi:signal recognition particle GTPase
MKKINTLALTLPVLIVLLQACAYKKEVAETPCVLEPSVSFVTKVAPIIQSNCFQCHNNNFKLGNVTLEGYDNIKKVAASGKLFNVINHSPGFAKMPKNSNKLDDCSIATIKKWIDGGTPNN